MSQSLQLVDQSRAVNRMEQLSLRTEASYLADIKACLRLRVKDLAFEYRQMTIRDGKGQVKRRTMLPVLTIEPLQQQLMDAKRVIKWT